ncbi:MAG: hypothetical protein K8T25_18130 [Planctomycetia bacterium]|nr:hypothetical protein [Planctomycetia bacterium]
MASTQVPRWPCGLVIVVCFLPWLAGCGRGARGSTTLAGSHEESSVALETSLRGYDDRVQRFGGHASLTLDLAKSSITDADLANVPLPEQLRSVDLSYTKITDAGLAPLKKATHLRSLLLVDVQITDASLETIRALPELEVVDLKHTQVSNAAQLALMKELRQRTYDRQLRQK